MSRPDRPYRSTRVLANRTVHHDFATKAERDATTCSEDTRTTVTSRKPVKPGTPVCWVNWYQNRTYGVWSTKEHADQSPLAAARLHCIPVYLPGEGEPPGPDAYYQQWRDMKAERDAAQAEVEQWKDAAEHADGKLSEERMSSQSERKECDRLRAEVERLTKELEAERDRATAFSAELAAAQAKVIFPEQAMPAGKVVYGASGKFGINRDFQTIEFADKRLRDTYKKADGWTWFTRVEES